MSHLNQHADVVALIELMLEERISPEQFRQLEDAVRQDAAVRRFYIEYLDLHGLLHWNNALSSTDRADEFEPRLFAAEPAPIASRRRLSVLVASVTALIAFAAFAALWKPNAAELARQDAPHQRSIPQPNGGQLVGSSQPERTTAPIELPSRGNPDVPGTMLERTSINVADTKPTDVKPDGPTRAPGDSHESVVAFVNDELRRSWDDNEIKPSVRAEDNEWLRRAYLDLVGHIPTADQVRGFLADKRPNKREVVIDELLDHEDYIRNSTTIWTNLMIGRSNPKQVNRPAMQRFLRASFRENRRWDRVVTDIVSAEGNAEENGAANFLIAHLNNQAVPATAITAKLFLCQQVQCTQCHNHPFNDLQQDSFWSLNSFFKDVKVVDRPQAGNPKVHEVLLTHSEHPGKTFYETRNGVMKVAYPQFDGVRVSPEGPTDLRAELAKLMAAGDAPQMARAFVNRTWLHFMGAAFTLQVDDMGPHAAVSHPEVLDRLTREFVRSGYDVKQLIRWICRSETYQLSSRIGAEGVVDDPSVGELPQFSRMYVKTMSIEQVFDSLLIATDARETFGSNWEAVEHKRQEWLQQFVKAFDTDENDEADLFDGTIPQALMLMNGDLVQRALQSKQGTYLDRVARAKSTDEGKVESIALAALSRKPTKAEIAAVRSLMKDSSSSGAKPRNGEQNPALTSSLQDLFWAYLNSSEFILIH